MAGLGVLFLHHPRVLAVFYSLGLHQFVFQFLQAYAQTIETMNRLYNEVHLVHADLSEYNILWHEGQCW